jgi:hypothetical protein
MEEATMPDGPGANERIEAQGVGISVPPGFIDMTDYAFRAPDGSRRITVRPASGLGSDQELDAAARAYWDQARANLDAKDYSESPPAAQPDGSVVKVSSFRLRREEAGPVLREWCGFVRFPDGTGAAVSYTADEGDAPAEAEFRRVLASLRPAAAAQPGQELSFSPPDPPAPGHRRRQAGQVELDLPELMLPPRAFQFVSRDGAVQLSMDIAEPAPGPESVSFGTPAGGGYEVFGSVGVTPPDLGTPLEYEMPPPPEAGDEARAATPPDTGDLSFATPAGLEATGAAGPAVESRSETVGDARVRLSARAATGQAARAEEAIRAFASGLEPRP